METVSQGQKLFTTRLVIGLGQGLLLYLLYRAQASHAWPATDGAVFAPLLLVGVYGPILFILALGEMPQRRAALWFAVAVIAIATLAFFDNWTAWPQDWDYGSNPTARPHIIPSPQLIFFGGAGLLVAHALIVGAHIDHRVMAKYPTHFDVAWKLAVQVALAGGFVGAFWLLLWLGAGLFALIKLDFFRILIQHQWFSIPVTTMAAAGALHLADIRPALVRGARTLALTLLSWLLPVITLIVAGFLISLPFTGLAPLWSFGHASALLLAAAAALIILINAAYQDGDAERSPPKILRLSGSLAAILPLPLSLIAAYALYLRVAQYGWTVERIWMAAAALLGCAYAAGYVLAAAMPGPWLSRIERWNFLMSLGALAVLVALFTPIANPARISVADQMARLNSGKTPITKFDFGYLRWKGGRYGREALQTLAASQDRFTRKAADYALRQTNRYAPVVGGSPLFADHLTVYPPGQTLPQSFARMDWNKEGRIWMRPNCLAGQSCEAILADLDGDGRPEILIFSGQGVALQIFHEDTAAIWSLAGTIPLPPSCPAIADALRQGRFSISPPEQRWNDIQIGGQRLRFARPPEYDQGPVKCPS